MNAKCVGSKLKRTQPNFRSELTDSPGSSRPVLRAVNQYSPLQVIYSYVGLSLVIIATNPCLRAPKRSYYILPHFTTLTPQLAPTQLSARSLFRKSHFAWFFSVRYYPSFHSEIPFLISVVILIIFSDFLLFLFFQCLKFFVCFHQP
jgi:hypothetical protein